MRILKIKLGDEDRATFGCPEWMELDLDRKPNSEARELRAAGIDWLRVAQGEPLIDPDTRQPKRDKDGEVVVSRDWDTIHWVLVWKALRRAGRDFPLADVDFDTGQVEFIWPDEAGEDEGKDESSTP